MKLFDSMKKDVMKGCVSILNIEDYLERAEAEDTEAMLAVAKYYAEKDICFDDKKDSLYWYERAAINGNSEAQMFLGNHYAGNIVDVPKAIYWYKKAAEQGFSEGLCNLSKLNYRWSYRYQENKRLCKKFDLLECYKSAVQGNMEAQFDLAERYEYGCETERNLDQALFWYKEAGRKFKTEAWIKVIDIYKKTDNDFYANGEEIECCYFEMLACPDVKNYIDEILNIRKFLADYYEYIGEDETAHNYRDLASLKTDKFNSIEIQKANKNYEKMQYDETILICKKNNDNTLPLMYWKLKLLAEQGYSEAQYYLGSIEEIKGNKEHAFFWYSRAAEQANVKALKKIAFFYEHGVTIKRNIEEAKYYYNLATLQEIIALKDGIVVPVA